MVTVTVRGKDLNYGVETYVGATIGIHASILYKQQQQEELNPERP